MDHVAERQCVDLFRIDLRALHCFAYDLRRELCRRKVLQRTAVVADCRARTAQYNHLAFAVHAVLLESIVDCLPAPALRRQPGVTGEGTTFYARRPYSVEIMDLSPPDRISGVSLTTVLPAPLEIAKRHLRA